METIREQIESLNYGQGKRITGRLVTHWVMTYEVDTKCGKKSNTFKEIDALVKYLETTKSKPIGKHKYSYTSVGANNEDIAWWPKC